MGKGWKGGTEGESEWKGRTNGKFNGTWVQRKEDQRIGGSDQRERGLNGKGGKTERELNGNRA